MNLPDLYNEYYYAYDLGEPYGRSENWLRLNELWATRIVQDIQPQTVLDVGCGIAMLVEALRDRDVEAWGFDVSEFAIAQVPAAMRPYCWVGSAAKRDSYLRAQYDLITCIEVVEHMWPREAELAIQWMCQRGAHVLFSSSSEDYAEATHVNVRPAEDWAREFARHGMFRVWDIGVEYVTSWAVLYQHATPPPHQLAYAYERLLARVLRQNREQRGKILEMQQLLSERSQCE